MTTPFAKLLERLKIRRPAESVTEAVADADLSEIPAMVERGRISEAEDLLRTHLSRHPDSVDALHFLGLVCHRTGRFAEATRHIGEAASRSPNVAFLHANLAEAFRAAGDLASAEEAARTALHLAPDQPDARFNLALILSKGCARAEALEHALIVLQARPDWPEALTLAANMYIALDDRGKARDLLDRARALRPDDAGILVQALRNRAWICDWDDDSVPESSRRSDTKAFEAMVGHWAANPRGSEFKGLNPFVTYEYPVAQHLRNAVTQGYADDVIDRVKHLQLPVADAKPSGTRQRLRIGYVSADFHRHPVMQMMRSFYALHDRTRFEIFAYSIGEDDGSDYRRHAVASVDHFIDIRRDTILQSAERIQHDGIDILVDLKGYTNDARPEMFALRPAPLRVSWMGYTASTGHGINDYVIVDRVVAPPEHQSQFGERLVWMPHTFQVNDHEQPIAEETPPRAALGLPDKGFVFACFNHLYKVEPRMFSVWMRILARIHGSVLWLYESNPVARNNLKQAATARGIEPDRLVFGGTMDKPRHLARLRQADLFLDTLWFNAHTGTSDALWAGVPALTCPQDTFPARVAASLVTAAGLPQLVCADLGAFEEAAVRLASHPAELKSMRERLTHVRSRLPLFDTPRFTRNLESAFETMWRQHLSGDPPQAFAVIDDGSTV
jgi:predicted O-linked N-acetylglucosamine transferase (SPINDLY family)